MTRYVKDLASRAGPFPRRQCLQPSRLIAGRVPRGRKLVVSHAWDTAFHISPSGAKMRLVLEEMERLGATGDEDAVFSAPAHALAPRTPMPWPRV